MYRRAADGSKNKQGTGMVVKESEPRDIISLGLRIDLADRVASYNVLVINKLLWLEN